MLDDLGQTHLAGDLAEELHAGRSPSWCWWQVSAAVVRGVISIIRRNPVLAIRAVGVGWIVIAVLNGQLPFRSYPNVGMSVHQSPVWVALVAAQYLIAGWVVARLHPRHPVSMVVVSAVVLTILNGLTVTIRAYFLFRFGPFVGQELSAMEFISLVTSFCLPLVMVAGGLWTGTRDPRPTAD
jgi:hypothetical protein